MSTDMDDRQANFQLLFAASPYPMWVFDRDTFEFLEVNEAAVRHYGYTREEFLEMRVTDIRPPSEVERFRARVVREGDEWRFFGEWQHLVKTGNLIDVDIRSAAVRFNGRPAEIVIAQDISGRRRLEAQLRQTQKLEAISQLAAGIAHDLNNMLTAILGFSELAAGSVPEGDPVQEYLQEVCNAGGRAASLTARLLAFGRTRPSQAEVLDSAQVVNSMLPMLRRLVPEHVDLKIGFPSKVVPIAIDPSQFEQILVNLVVNGADAMPRGGVLAIEGSAAVLDGTEEQEHLPVLPGEYAVFTISDTGVGMDFATRRRIFEPFFTTKPAGKGTGLGLPTVYAIVRQNGGGLSVRTKPAGGTTFEIYLPVAKDPVETGQLMAARGIHTGSETVLLVEDDRAVRQLSLATLRNAGYRVLHAPNPRRAAEVAAVHEGPIHLLLSDVIMPESDGPPLFQTLAGTHPALRVLYMSGYADDVVLEQGIEPRSTPFINKPFTPQTLTLKIREVLDAPPPSIPAGAGSLLAGKA